MAGPRTAKDSGDLYREVAKLREEVRKLKLHAFGNPGYGGGGDGNTLPHTTLRTDWLLDGTTTEIPVVDIDRGFRISGGGTIVVWSDGAATVFTFTGVGYDFPLVPSGPKLTGVTYVSGDTGTFDAGAFITLVGAP